MLAIARRLQARLSTRRIVVVGPGEAQLRAVSEENRVAGVRHTRDLSAGTATRFSSDTAAREANAGAEMPGIVGDCDERLGCGLPS
jgi:hypothetical protein